MDIKFYYIYCFIYLNGDRYFMLKYIFTFFANQFDVETENDVLKIIGLHMFIVLGFLSGLLMFVKDLSGLSADGCLPGDVSILIIFGLSFYGLRHIRISWAVNIFFMIPFVTYFFFIAESYSIFPNHLSVQYTLWTLIPFFLFFLIFSDKAKSVSIFYILSFLSLLFHVFIAGLTDYLFLFKWEIGAGFINPFLTLSVFYLASIIIAWNFQTRLNELGNKKKNTDSLINQAVQSLSQGMMLLEIARDEFGETSHFIVRKTNPAFERLFKITSREIKDQKTDDVFLKIFRSSFDYNNLYFNTKKNHFSFYLDHLDRYYEVENYKLTNGQLVSLFSDVSAKQKLILDLEESKQRFQVLLEAVPDLFFIIDKDGTYVDFVFKASEALKIKPEDIIGNSIFEVGFSEKMSNKIFQCIQQSIESDTIETIEYALEIESSTAMFEMRIARLNDHSVISLARDITKRKIAEINLEDAKNRAEESDRLKTAFLANISHEIRTPMNAIIGFSKMVGSPDFDDEEKSNFIEIIITNGKLLLELINDMITLSKIESNTLVVKKSLCRINNMMDSLYSEFSNEVEDKKFIRIKLTCENSNPKFAFITDPALLQSILQKLIDNSIKFTEQGEVEFGYKFTEPSLIEFFVKDTGIGIAERDLERIFERFHQLDNRISRTYEGIGLGLSIAQHYVRLLGGDLKVNSKLGKGSVFSFSLPYEREESPLKIVR